MNQDEIIESLAVLTWGLLFRIIFYFLYATENNLIISVARTKGHVV
jgi:hypothetical protein